MGNFCQPKEKPNPMPSVSDDDKSNGSNLEQNEEYEEYEEVYEEG